MAKPDCSDGWHKIAYELEAAVCFASFSRVARIVLRYVFAQIYGKGERPLFAFLPQALIAQRIGLPRQNIWRAVAELVEAGVLDAEGKDCYRFVKDYDLWKAKDGGPMLTGLEVEDCRSSADFGHSFDLSDASMDETRSGYGFTMVKPDPVTPTEKQHDCVKPDSVTCNQNVNLVKPDPVSCNHVPETRSAQNVNLVKPYLVTPTGESHDCMKPDLVTKPSPLNNPLLGIEFISLSNSRERDPVSPSRPNPDETDHGRPVEYPSDPEEPFASDESATPAPLPVVLTAEQARLKTSVEVAARKATRRAGSPDGIDEAAEAMADWALEQLEAGARVTAIKDSVGKACRKIADGMAWGSGPSYAETCIRGWKANPSSKSSASGDAWKPAPPAPEYFKAPPPNPKSIRGQRS